VEDFRPQLDGRSLRVNLSQECPESRPDPDHQLRCSRHVIDNCLYYSLPATCNRSCGGNASAEALLFEFGDQGPGIPRRERELDLRPFLPPPVRKGSRSVLAAWGLYISRELVSRPCGVFWWKAYSAPFRVFVLMLPTHRYASIVKRRPF